MKPYLFLLLISLTAGGVGVCPRPAAAAETAAPYRLGPEDRISVKVARHPEWDVELLVIPQDGKIVLPVVGSIDTTGLTIADLESRVREGFSKRLRQPEVYVILKEARKQRVYVSGAGVKLGGAFDWKPGWRVTEAIGEAQGVLDKPERHVATLFRLGQNPVRLDLHRIYALRDPAANLPLQPGDIIDVQLEPTIRVYVGGAVKDPKSVEVPAGGGIHEAITLAGGLLPTAVASRTTLHKEAGGTPVVLDLNRAVNNGAAAPVVKLTTGDVIFVPENRATISVVGAVLKPNSFPLQDGKSMSLLEAIALAEGLRPEARSSRVVVQRADGTSQEVNLYATINEGQAATPVLLAAGDVVKVPENTSKFSVFGSVKMPGTHTLPDGKKTTVLEGISLAQGYEKDAEKTHIGIIRGAPANPTLIEVDLKDLIKAARNDKRGAESGKGSRDGKSGESAAQVAQNFILQEGDIVVVSRNKRPDWATVLNGVQNLGIFFFTLL